MYENDSNAAICSTMAEDSPAWDPSDSRKTVSRRLKLERAVHCARTSRQLDLGQLLSHGHFATPTNCIIANTNASSIPKHGAWSASFLSLPAEMDTAGMLPHRERTHGQLQPVGLAQALLPPGGAVGWHHSGVQRLKTVAPFVHQRASVCRLTAGSSCPPPP
jgi:hypothetical protein